MRSSDTETLQRHLNVISRVALLGKFLVNPYIKDMFVPMGLSLSVFFPGQPFLPFPCAQPHDTGNSKKTLFSFFPFPIVVILLRLHLANVSLLT